MKIESNLEDLGLTLPPPPKPVANYLPAVRVGDLVFTSGVLPMKEGRLAYEGRLGEAITVEQGQEAARLAVLNALAVIRQELGSLDLVVRIVKLTGYIASLPDFKQQPAVLNGASDLLMAVFGGAGRHARVAVGAAALPLGAPVEIELIAQFRPGS
jgi:enamine deaminase RidA (YjgF/YER057c/UK114 family)